MVNRGCQRTHTLIAKSRSQGFRCCDPALCHAGLVLHLGLTSLRLFRLYRKFQCYVTLDFDHSQTYLITNGTSGSFYFNLSVSSEMNDIAQNHLVTFVSKVKGFLNFAVSLSIYREYTWRLQDSWRESSQWVGRPSSTTSLRPSTVRAPYEHSASNNA